MSNKLIAGVVALSLCAACCPAQTHKPSSVIAPPRTAPLDIRPWLSPFNNRQTPLTLFPQMTTSPQNWDPMDMDWGRAELAARLATIQRGMLFKTAVQRLRLLGGVEDGGLQSVPATRYFFKPGYIVTVPQKEGRVSGPLQVVLGQMAYD